MKYDMFTWMRSEKNFTSSRENAFSDTEEHKVLVSSRRNEDFGSMREDRIFFRPHTVNTEDCRIVHSSNENYFVHNRFATEFCPFLHTTDNSDLFDQVHVVKVAKVTYVDLYCNL